MLVYDCEIQKCIPDRRKPNDPALQYCNGWDDHANMGVSCIVAFDFVDRRFRIFTHDDLSEFGQLAQSRQPIIGFNSISFDDRLCNANGVQIETHYDILRAIWEAAGLDPSVFNPRTHGGYGLDACVKAAFGLSKSGTGALAPVWFQQGRLGRVIDYCLDDVRLTCKLLRRIVQSRTLPCPKTGGTLNLKSEPWMDEWKDWS